MRTLPSSPGHPTAQRVAEIDHIILTAAQDIFFEGGYESATMAAIAKRAVISKGTLYARYSSKYPLLRAVLKTGLVRWSDLADSDGTAAPDGVHERLRYHARKLIKVYCSSEFQKTMALVESVSVEFPDIIRDFYHLGGVEYVEYVGSDLRRTASAIETASNDWHMVASTLIHSLSNWFRFHSLLDDLTEDQVEAHASRLIALLIR